MKKSHDRIPLIAACRNSSLINGQALYRQARQRQPRIGDWNEFSKEGVWSKDKRFSTTARMYVIQASHQLSLILMFQLCRSFNSFLILPISASYCTSRNPSALHCPYSHQSEFIIMLRGGKVQRMIQYETADPPKASSISRWELETETRRLVNSRKEMQFAQSIRRQKATVSVSLDGYS